MKFNDVQTLESLLKKLNEYGNTPGGPSYNAGGTSSTKTSPTTSKSSTSVTKQSPSPTANGTKAPEPKLVKVTAKDLDDGSEFKDDKGNVQGKVVSKVGMLPQPDKVVVQTADDEYHLYDPKLEVMVDEHIGHDILDKMTIKKSHKKNSLKRRIKKLTRKRLGEAPLCEINFNTKEIVTDALDSPVRCGFEAETSWSGISSSSSEDVNDMSWDEVYDSLYISGSTDDYVMEGFSEYVRENLVPDYYDDVMANFLENEREDDESYARFMEDGDGPTVDAVQEYKDNFQEEDPKEFENRQEDGWEFMNWCREFIDEEYEDSYLDFVREYLDDDGEVFQEAFEEAQRDTSIDEWIGNEFYNMANFLDDYGIDYSELSGEGGLHEIAELLSEWQTQNSKFSGYPEVGDYGDTSGDATEWAVETDSSIDSDGQGAEIISPVYETPREMLEELKSFCEWLEEKGADTNSSTGLHVTMSWYGNDPKLTQDDDDKFWGSEGGPNKLKMASLLGDTYLLQTFGRENNSYTKQQSKNIKNKANDARKLSGRGSEGFADIEAELSKGIDSGKFNSINFKSQKDSETGTNLIEFRIGGGEDYHKDMPKIVKAVIRYATVMKAGYTDTFNKDYATAIHRIVHGAGKISRADMNIGSDVNEPLLDLFKSMISKDNYFNGVTAITNAYLSLYQVGNVNEAPEPSETNVVLQEAQREYVKGIGLLAVDVALGKHRMDVNAKSIGVIRRSFKEFNISEDQFTDLILSRINNYQIPTQNDRIDQKAAVLKKGVDALFKKDVISMPKFLNIPKAERIVKGTWNAIHSDGWSRENQEELLDKLVNLTTPDVAEETKRNNIKYSIMSTIEDEEFNSFYSNMTRGGYNSSNPPAQPGEIYYEDQFKDLMKFLNKYNNYSQPVAPHFNSNISSSDTYLENYLNSYTMKLRKRFLHLEEIKNDNFQLYVDSVKKIGELSRTLLNAWGDHEQVEVEGVHNHLVFTVYNKEKLIEIFKDIKNNEMADPNTGSVLNRLGDRLTDSIRDGLGRYYRDIEKGDPVTGTVKKIVKQRFKSLKDWMQGFDKIAQEVGFESQADEIAGKNNIPSREDDFQRSVQERPPITLNIPAHSQAYMWADLYRALTNPDYTAKTRKAYQLRAKSEFTTKLNKSKVFVIPAAHWSQAHDAYEIQKSEESHEDWRSKAARLVMKEFYKIYGRAFSDLVDNPAEYVSINGLKTELKKEGIAISTEGDSREPNVKPLVSHTLTSQPGAGTPMSPSAAAAWHINNPELSKKAKALTDKNDLETGKDLQDAAGVRGKDGESSNGIAGYTNWTDLAEYLKIEPGVNDQGVNLLKKVYDMYDSQHSELRSSHSMERWVSCVRDASEYIKKNYKESGGNYFRKDGNDDVSDIYTTPDQQNRVEDAYKARSDWPGFDAMMRNGMQNYLPRGEVNDLVNFLNSPNNDAVFKANVLQTMKNQLLYKDQPFASFQDALAATRRSNESVFSKFNNLSLQEQIAKLENIDANRISQLHGKFVEGSLNRNELSKDQSRFDAFVNKINAGIPFQKTEKAGGGEIVLHPDMIKDVTVASDLPDPIDIDGNKVTWNQLEKTAEFGSRSGGEKVSNKGEVAEGILGCATFARLLKRPIAPITDSDIKAVMKRLPTDAPDKGGWHELTLTARETDNPIADFFTLTLNLKSDTYKDFINPEKWALMNNISNNVVSYVNDNMDKYTKLFAKNGKVDAVKVIADGVSGETDTKVDVFLTHSLDGGPEKTLQHYDMSVKVGSTKQMGQVGGGKKAQGVSTERFFILKEMFEKFGADLSVIEKQFMSSETINDAYVIAYSEAAKQINTHLTTEDKEVDWLMQFLNTIKFFATLNDDRVKLVQFEDTLSGGYYVLDFKKLDRMMDKNKVDLEAVFIDDKAQPKITIINKVNNKPFLSIRKKQAQNDGYIRNYIEKEKGLVELIKVRGSGMRKKVESVQESKPSHGVNRHNEKNIPAMIKLVDTLFRKKVSTVDVQRKLTQEFGVQAFEARHVISMWKELNSVKEGAVPNNDTIRKLREIFAKPLMSDDLKAQMNAYICIPDPAMIRDFRAARAQYGNNFDMRSIVRGYAKVKLHKTLQKQLSK